MSPEDKVEPEEGAEYQAEWDKLTAEPTDDDDPLDGDDEEPEGVVRATGDDTPAEKVEDDPAPAEHPETQEERITRLESENADYQHKLQSEAGRSAGLQQKLREIRNAEVAPSQAVINKALEDPKLWAEFKESYPEMSTSIESLVATEGNKIRESMKQEFAAVIQPLDRLNFIT